MKKEPLKMALIQIEVEPNQPHLNVCKMLKIIEGERAKGVKLIIFPELVVSGYMIGDRWNSRSLMHDFINYNEDIIEASKGITIIWGNVELDESKTNANGSVRKYSAAFVASDGKMLCQPIRKTNLPAYGEFDDKRYFSSLADIADEQHCKLADLVEPIDVFINGSSYKIGVILCEDMWWSKYGMDRNIAEILRKKGADFIINISCSPWNTKKSAQRIETIKSLFKDGLGVPLAYCNIVGVQDLGKTVLVFDGDSGFYDAQGDLILKADKFKEQMVRVMVKKGKKGCEFENCGLLEVKSDVGQKGIAEIHDAIVYGIRKFMGRIGKSKVVIGLSGGIDSSVVAALWAEALGAQNVFAVNLCTEYNTKTTKKMAQLVAENFKINYGTASIQKNFRAQIQHLEDISFKLGSKKTSIKLSDLNRENIQSRIRGSSDLIGLASALNAVVSCNGNKTELAFGYCTLYGDLVGALAPLGDLSKGMIFDLAREINQRLGLEAIPDFIINQLPPSAELSLKQNVELGQGDPFYYPYHDQLAAAFVEKLWQPEDVMKMLIDDEIEKMFEIKKSDLLKFFGSWQNLIADLEKSWGNFNSAVFKRFQAPPIIKISERSFGFDFREAQNEVYFSKRYSILKQQFLAAIEK